MNSTVLQAKWKQLRGKAKDKWGKLTDQDLLRIEGKWDQLVGLLQEKYGYARERAEKEIAAFLKEHNLG